MEPGGSSVRVSMLSLVPSSRPLSFAAAERLWTLVNTAAAHIPPIFLRRNCPGELTQHCGNVEGESCLISAAETHGEE